MSTNDVVSSPCEANSATLPWDEPKVLYHTPDFLVVYKPPFYTVDTFNESDSSKDNFVNCYVQTLEGVELASNFSCDRGVCHRLDRETSGVLLVAKNKAAWSHIREEFGQRRVKKLYITLVHGLASPSDTIRLPLKVGHKRDTRTVVAKEGKKAQAAVTHYKCLAHFLYRKDVDSEETESYSLLQVAIETGRTHQIRVHLQAVGHPIVSDDKYNRSSFKYDSSWCPRLFLHAAYLEFMDKHGALLKCGAPLPTDLRAALGHLEEVRDPGETLLGMVQDSRTKEGNVDDGTDTVSDLPPPIVGGGQDSFDGDVLLGMVKKKTAPGQASTAVPTVSDSKAAEMEGRSPCYSASSEAPLLPGEELLGMVKKKTASTVVRSSASASWAEDAAYERSGKTFLGPSHLPGDELLGMFKRKTALDNMCAAPPDMGGCEAVPPGEQDSSHTDAPGDMPWLPGDELLGMVKRKPGPGSDMVLSTPTLCPSEAFTREEVVQGQIPAGSPRSPSNVLLEMVKKNTAPTHAFAAPTLIGSGACTTEQQRSSALCECHSWNHTCVTCVLL